MDEQSYRASKFEIDAYHGLLQQPVAGYWTGIRTSTWDCAYFAKETADKIMAAAVAYGETASYDPETDTYTFNATGNPDDTEQYQGFDITVEGQTVRVYPIGTGSWVWEEYTRPMAIHIERFEIGDGVYSWIAYADSLSEVLAYGVLFEHDDCSVTWQATMIFPQDSQENEKGAAIDMETALKDLEGDIREIWG